ncbi:MAG TPA: glycosyltransferase, partial [Gemmatimonadales bacterium]|nr:glycosyltransferase [Gemmatimonadales bacterium]
MLFPPAESLLWLLPYATIPYLARRKPALVECPPLTTGPLVSVIVPARNEADNIGPLLESLRRT